MKKIISSVLATFIIAEMCMTNCFAFEKTSFDSKIAELTTLRKQCAEKNISTAYEDINYYTIKKCVDLVEEDTAHYSAEIMNYNETALEKLYTEARDNMKSYLNGSKKPKQSHIYKAGGINVDGRVLKDSDGRPLYSIGVGHGSNVLTDLHKLKNYGYSNIQIEIGPNSIIKEDANSQKGYSIDKTGLDRIKKAFERADASGIIVNLLISTHYLPDFMYTKYPELSSSKGNFKLNCDHDGVNQVIADFLNALMPEIKDYKSLASIILANEPGIAQSEQNNKVFRTYLRKLYNKDISNLNAAYGTNYTSWTDIVIPTNPDGAIAYDWMNCADDMLTRYIAYVGDIVSKYTNVPKSVKTMREWERYENSEDENDYKRVLFRGVSPEKLKSVSGMAGTDEESYYRHGGGTSMQETMMWYDMLHSVYDMPIYNSEDHLIGNGDERYNDSQRIHTTGSLWQSAIHGLYMSSMWIWERSYDIQQFKNQLLSRPDVIAATGKVNYELNRLANKVSAISEKQPRVAILQSDAARIYENETDRQKTHAAACSQYYLSTLYSGEKVGFITDTAYEHLDKYKVLIIPQVMNTPKAVLNKIKQFVENGGKVIIYEYKNTSSSSWNSLKKDEYNRDNDSATVKYILDNAYKTSKWGNDSSKYLGNAEITNELVKQFKTYFGQKVELVDSNGNPISGVDWTWTEYDGKLLVNLCSYVKGDLSGVRIKVNGNIIGNSRDLISETSYTSSFNLKEMTPVLLEIGDVTEQTPSKDIINLSYNRVLGNLIWKIAVDDDMYSGANIYRINDDGSTERLGTALGTEFKYNGQDKPEMLVIKAFNKYGVESKGIRAAIGMNKYSLTVGEPIVIDNTITVNFTNDTPYNLYKKIMIKVFDSNDKLVNAAGTEKILQPAGSDSISFSCELPDNYYIKVEQN